MTGTSRLNRVARLRRSPPERTGRDFHRRCRPHRAGPHHSLTEPMIRGIIEEYRHRATKNNPGS
jgi:hypothetical protein